MYLDILKREEIDSDIDTVIESYDQHRDIRVLVSEVRDKITCHLEKLAEKVDEVIREFADSYLGGIVELWKTSLEQAEAFLISMPNTADQKIDVGMEIASLKKKMQDGNITIENYYEEFKSYKLTLEKASSSPDSILVEFGKKMAEAKEQLEAQMRKDGTIMVYDGRISYCEGRKTKVPMFTEEAREALKHFRDCVERCDYPGIARNHLARRSAEKLSLFNQIPGKTTIDEILKALELMEGLINYIIPFVEDLRMYMSTMSPFDVQASLAKLDKFREGVQMIEEEGAYRKYLISYISNLYGWEKVKIPEELVKSEDELQSMDNESLEQMINKIIGYTPSYDRWRKDIIYDHILPAFYSTQSFESRESSKSGSILQIITSWGNGPLQLCTSDDRSYLFVNIRRSIES